MNKLSIALIGIIAFGFTLSATAGPDFQTIEQARKASQSRDSIALNSINAKDCESKRFVPLVDHGPRAQTTPHLNQQRKLQFEAESAQCKKQVAG